MKYSFTLDKNFIDTYREVPSPFGFNGLGEFVFMRTYSHQKTDGTFEKWFEVCQRVVEGSYRLQKDHILKNSLPWSEAKAQKSAQEMYDRMFNMKWLPPGRGLWAMGSPITEERGIWASVNNCGFVSTKTTDPSKPFEFMMDMSMVGVGVGFDTKGVGLITIHCPDRRRDTEVFVIPDDREGWVESLRLLLRSHFVQGSNPVEFDYSIIRPKGSPIRGFGGKASGPEPLKLMHEKINEILYANKGRLLSSLSIVDRMNLIGQCVVAGNVRRTAQLAIGDPADETFLDLKNPEVFPERNELGTGWSWTSNNSIDATIGMDYSGAAERTRLNGEPGYVWLENARKFSRMGDPQDNKDYRVAGFNPCSEQTLESMELCCLVETFPNHHEDTEDFIRTLKYAYLYAKSVTLGMTHWPETNRVLARNRRIGTSVTGIAQFIATQGLDELRHWLTAGYDYLNELDNTYSEWLAVPRSIKMTSVKPSGSVSLLAGATPGIHYPEGRYYIRRVRVDKHSELIPPLRLAGYKVEDDAYDKSSAVVEFPIDAGEGVRTAKDVSMWEQLSLAAFMQKYWADNAVSVTVRFDPETEGHQIESALDYFQYQLKAVSFLPALKGGAYKQMPYEEIDEATYKSIVRTLKKPDFSSVRHIDSDVELFCDSDSCEIFPRNETK